MWKKVPGVPVGAVVFAYGAPLPFAEVGAPLFPVRLLLRVFLKSVLFGRQGWARHMKGVIGIAAIYKL